MIRWPYGKLIEGLEREKQQLQTQIAEVSDEKEGLQERIEGLQDQIEALQEQTETVSSEKEHLRAYAEEIQTENVQLLEILDGFGPKGTVRACDDSVLSDPDREYEDSHEHLLDELRRIDCLLSLHVGRWRAEGGGPVMDTAGVYISDEEVDRLLQSEPTRKEQAGASVEGAAESADPDPLGRAKHFAGNIEERKRRSEGVELRLDTLAERFDLVSGDDRTALDAFLLAVAPEFDQKYETIYGYLHDNVTRKRPTVDLVLRTLAPSAAERLDERRLFARTSSLRRNGLLRLEGGSETALSTRAVVVDERIVDYLLGVESVSESLGDYVEVKEAGWRPTSLIYPTKKRDEFGAATEGEESAGTGKTVEGEESKRPDEIEPADDAMEHSRADEGGEIGEPDEDGGYDEVNDPSRDDADGQLERLRLDEDVRVQLTNLCRRERELEGAIKDDSGGPEYLMAYFYGPYGSGRTAAVAALTAERDPPRALLVTDVQGLLANGVRETVRSIRREATLQRADVLVTNLESLDDQEDIDLRPLLRALDECEGRVYLSGEEPPKTSQRQVLADHRFVGVHFPVPSYGRRVELWGAVEGLPVGLDVSDLAGKFRLTAGQIEDAVETARSRAYGSDLTAEDVYAGCRAQSREKLSTLGRVVEPNYGWEDIVLPEDTESHLREVAAHIRYQGRVYADWGFKEKFSLGNGVIALFTGPSGTGKTMAAEVIANDAGLDLYKIDLSNVVSKYIGETESNLGEVFDEAENSDAILFFDEADALFGKRSEVSDAHDRYANIEVNYLLQRVEEHDGAVILTTNFKQNIDEAFLRRIHLRVDFPRPDREAREMIWRNIFPVEETEHGEKETTPHDELNYEFLSEFELTGGNIKNIALTAAFLAAGPRTDEEEAMYDAERRAIRELITEEVTRNGESNLPSLGSVKMEHVVRAMRREFQKTGNLIRPEMFGEYRAFLPE